jgi:hypothetical protein
MPGPSLEPGRPTEPHTLFTGIPASTAALPPGVVENLEKIREHADATHRQMPLAEERSEANMARAEAERRLQRLLAHPHEGGFNLHETDVRVREQRKLLDQLTIAAKRLDDRYRKVSEAWQPKARTRGDCESWLKTLPHGTAVTDWVGPEPKLAKGEDLLTAVARLERRTRELGADLHRCESAPYPSTFAKARMREQIETLAACGVPAVSLLIEHADREVVWPRTNLQLAVYNTQTPSFAASEVTDVLALTCWLHKDTLLAKLDALIAGEADDASALSIEARQTQAAQITADLLAVERDLAWCVWAGLSQGLPVWFGNVSPTAILAAELVSHLAVNGGGSSPERAGYDLLRGGGPR